MENDDFSFKFPEFDFKDFEVPAINKSTLDKIHEYLDADIQDQNLLLQKLIEFERKLDTFY